MSDLARTLAFAFRRKGADSIPGTELRMLLAYDLRWFAPEDAKRVVQRGIEAGLIAEREGAIVPLFDARAVEVPLNFRPTTSVLDAPIVPGAPPAAAPTTPAAAPAQNDLERAAEDERRRRGLLIRIEVARLIVRRRAGEDVAAEAAALETSLLARK